MPVRRLVSSRCLQGRERNKFGSLLHEIADISPPVCRISPAETVGIWEEMESLNSIAHILSSLFNILDETAKIRKGIQLCWICRWHRYHQAPRFEIQAFSLHTRRLDSTHQLAPPEKSHLKLDTYQVKFRSGTSSFRYRSKCGFIEERCGSSMKYIWAFLGSIPTLMSCLTVSLH